LMPDRETTDIAADDDVGLSYYLARSTRLACIIGSKSQQLHQPSDSIHKCYLDWFKLDLAIINSV